MKFIFYLLLLVVCKDFYKILDVDKNADDKTIKAAYRRLSKQYHPDKNSDEDAHEKFIEIGEAYDVLSDKEKRQNYDNYGDPNGQEGIDLGDIFNQFFGGNRQGNTRNQKRKGEHKQVRINLGLSDFYTGRDLDFELNMNRLCEHCKGTGSSDGKQHTCGKCQGQGILLVKKQFGPGMFQQFQVQCDECQGKRFKITNKCKKCDNGVVNKSEKFNIYVKPGAKREDMVVIENEGDENIDWVPGDILVKLFEDYNKNSGYRRIGNNLYRTEVITLAEATKGGWKRSIGFFDSDEDIVIERSKGVQVLNNEVEVIKGKGMPVDDDFGDLFIEYKVLVPEPQFVKDEL
ncbi:dnaJ-related protein Scj1p [[Candida] jaroonii]|uniref:DnaJ-related protein Scj1p n=1 Tax=[Candida] jaroonii TaxID=467808 RepID=A0ACA9Y918_9ASCO|nr:dnaJ-related protein Scj1p [[Candida] jaroonii]